MASTSVTELLNQKQKRLDDVPAQLIDSVGRAERQILYAVRLLLESFERNEEGHILTSSANIEKINILKSQLQQILGQTEYLQAIKQFALEFDAHADLNQELYAASVDYSESAIATAMVNNSKKRAIQLLTGGALDSAFYDPVVSTINNAVSTNAGFTETVEALQITITGSPTVDGRLSRYVKQIASDSFALSDRVYNNQVSEELNLEFYRYVGGLIEDTRDFCKVRNGKYFHKKEVESWALGGGSDAGNPYPNGQWQGQYQGTNSASIFNLCGGYNCKHTLMPVSIAAVPKDVLQRNITSGNVSLTERQKEVLLAA